jgi:hypothetical protein
VSSKNKENGRTADRSADAVWEVHLHPENANLPGQVVRVRAAHLAAADGTVILQDSGRAGVFTSRSVHYAVRLDARAAAPEDLALTEAAGCE